MLRPPATVEYICLSCGAQGSAHREVSHDDEPDRGGTPLKCPKCGNAVLFLERMAASDFRAAQPVDKP